MTFGIESLPPTAPTLRVVLVDAQTGFRQLLRAHLEETFTSLQVVAGTGLGREALSLSQLCQADLLLIDHCLPDLPAAEIIATARRQLPLLRILLHAGLQPGGLAAALAAGAHGCVMKTEGLEELETGLRLVASGAAYFSPKTPRNPEAAPEVTLTLRQRQVASLIASGLSTKEVASQLQISVKTADHHRTRLMKKLKVHDLTGVIRYAMRTGLTVL